MIYRILKNIYNHPFNSDNKFSGISRFFKWQINCYLNPYPIIYPYTENSKLIIRKGLTGATGNLYSGLMEFYDMGFLLHFLRPDDLFVDVGSNIGSYTILASAEKGAYSIAIEPIPSTYSYLLENIRINNVQNRVKALNLGIGSSKGFLKFTSTQDATNHVATSNSNDTLKVEVETLDSLLTLENTPTLLKIDVEGYETEVINGAINTLKNKDIKAIIIELNGLGSRYGYNEEKIHLKLLDLKYKPYSYNPKTRKLKELETYGKYNTIYIREKDFVNNRLLNERKIKIGDTNQYI